MKIIWGNVWFDLKQILVCFSFTSADLLFPPVSEGYFCHSWDCLCWNAEFTLCFCSFKGQEVISCQQVMELTGLILTPFFQPEGSRVSPSYHQPAVKSNLAARRFGGLFGECDLLCQLWCVCRFWYNIYNFSLLIQVLNLIIFCIKRQYELRMKVCKEKIFLEMCQCVSLYNLLAYNIPRHPLLML